MFAQEISALPDYKAEYSFYSIKKKIEHSFYKGLYYFITGDYADSDRLDEKYFQTCLKEENNDPIYNYYCGIAQKERTESMPYYLRSENIFLSNVEARFQLGLYYYKLKMYDRALEYFIEAEKINDKKGVGPGHWTSVCCFGSTFY